MFGLSRQLLLTIGGLLLLSLGLMVCLGWYTHTTALIQIHSSFVPMQFNTAVGFAFIGLSLLSLGFPHFPFSRWLMPFVFGLGFTTLLQYLFNLNLGIDQLFMRHYITVATSHPGRMAPNTDLNFSLSSLSIWLLGHPRPKPNTLLFCSILGALVTGLATVAILGYLSGVVSAYGWGKLTQMAIHTSIGFIFTGLLIILEALWLSFKQFQKLPAPILPITSGLIGLTITIALWQAIEASELEISHQYGIRTGNFVAEALLCTGTLLSIALTIAIWVSQQLLEKLQSLQEAQDQILKLNTQLEELSYLDGLTNIPNRRLFDLRGQKEWALAYQEQESLSLILLDIDYFKAYNDRYGHPQGDWCLQQLAKVITQMTPHARDLAARYGGEEFVLLLPNRDFASAETIAWQMLKAIQRLKIPHAASPHFMVTASVGISSCIPAQADGLDRLIHQADRALYIAKDRGRNCVVALDDSPDLEVSG